MLPLRLLSDLVPEHGAQERFLMGTNVNTFFQVPRPEFGHVLGPWNGQWHIGYPVSAEHGTILCRHLGSSAGAPSVNTASWDREHIDRKAKVYVACSHVHMFTTCLITCLSYTVPVYWPWHAPAKLEQGGHFGVLTGMYRATNSAKPLAKIRFAFHFVKCNNMFLKDD